jgi:hypothetical protein
MHTKKYKKIAWVDPTIATLHVELRSLTLLAETKVLNFQLLFIHHFVNFFVYLGKIYDYFRYQRRS